MATPFKKIINKFLGKITDDMYLELTYQDTVRDSVQILLDAIPYFEFPRFPLYDYDEVEEQYNCDLTVEEINILALLMKTAWLDRQINSIENTRMKYSGADFKLTSQANHLAKLLQLKTENVRESTHAQRLYKRRKTVNGQIQSNWGMLGVSVFDTVVSTNTTVVKTECDCEDIGWDPITGQPVEPPKDDTDIGWDPITGKPTTPPTQENDDGYIWVPIRD